MLNGYSLEKKIKNYKNEQEKMKRDKEKQEKEKKKRTLMADKYRKKVENFIFTVCSLFLILIMLHIDD